MKPTRIVVVDDDDATRDLLVECLSGSSRICVPVRNAKEALAEVAKQEVDLVITNIFMQGANGIELLRRLKELYPTLHVVIVTGASDPSLRRMAFNLGAADYVLKPFKVATFVASINHLLEGRGSASPRRT